MEVAIQTTLKIGRLTLNVAFIALYMSVYSFYQKNTMQRSFQDTLTGRLSYDVFAGQQH